MLPIRINDISYDIPTTLSEITLGQFLDFYTKYGSDLDQQLKKILERTYEDDFDRQIDLSHHEDQEALGWFSFWTGQDLFSISEADASPLIVLYRSIKILLMASEEASYDLPAEIEWNGDLWQISDFKVTPKSQFTFNELLTSKEVVRQTKSLGRGKWHALPYLACVFFRKIGEKYSEEFVMEGSERMALILSLPLEHALKIAFFLSVSINIYTKALVYSGEAVEQRM
jgi:hypothetical protein